MGEGRRRFLNGLSWILVGAGLAAWAGGAGLAWRARALDTALVGYPPEPGRSQALRVFPTPPVLPETIPSVALRTPSPMPGATPEAEPPLRLSIPAIRLEAPVIPVGLTTVQEGGREWITWEPPDTFAAGWLTTSAYPGQPGNVVLIGHHNIYGKVFANLYRLQPGDPIALETRQRIYVYHVEATHILPEKDQPLEVRQRHLQWVLPTPDERLTLVTCWPPHTNTHRLIVVARPVKP